MADQDEIVIYEDEHKSIVYYPLTGAVVIKTKSEKFNCNMYALITDEGADDFQQDFYKLEQWVISR